MAASRERTEENDGFHHSVHVADLTITDSIPGGGAACEDPRGTDAAEMVSSAHISSVGDQEDEGDQRGGSKARSGAPRAMDVDLPPLTQPSRADTHSLLVHNMSPANQAVSTASQLTAASVLKRTAELFPRGTTAPAAKPRQPPIVGKPTGELASLAFAASKDVELTRGKLAREEAAAFITADFLGIELLQEEALKLGESVRRAAQSVEDRVVAKEKAAAAKRSRLRREAAKDVGRAARLDTELQQLETETAAACEEIRRKEIKLNGLPDRSTQIVESRAPLVVDRGRPAGEPEQPKEQHPHGEICPRGHAMLEAAMSSEAALLIKAAFNHLHASRIRVHPVLGNEELEVAQVRFKYTLQRFHHRFPEHNDDWSDTVSDPVRVIYWALRFAAIGKPIPAAEECAKHASQYFDMQKVRADVKADVERKDWEVRL